jgi:hypothetical protein
MFLSGINLGIAKGFSAFGVVPLENFPIKAVSFLKNL